MSDAVNQKLTDSAVVAKLFGVTTRRVQQLTQEGIITGKKVKGVYKYDLPLVTQQYIKYLSDKLTGREKGDQTSEKENEKLEAEIKLKKAKAKMAELELKELEGKLHNAKDVEAMTTDLVLNIRSMLLALPGQLAVDMANIKTAAEASVRIKEAVNDILEELSNYEYNPKEYRRRLSERRGQSGEADDEEDIE